jgi:hypothetical protein
MAMSFWNSYRKPTGSGRKTMIANSKPIKSCENDAALKIKKIETRRDVQRDGQKQHNEPPNEH